MKKRRGGKPATPASRSTPPAPLSREGAEPPSKHSFLFHLIVDGLVGVAITMLLIVANWGIEKTAFGEEMRDTIYDLLQLRLASQFDPRTLDVAMVDISGIKMAGPPDSPEQQYTDRTELRKLIGNIANQRPKAIGIDIDFTPYPLQIKDDADFLNFCLRVGDPKSNSGYPVTPIFVATYASLAVGKSLALLDERFAPLAAFAGAPNAEPHESPEKMVETIDIYYKDEVNGAAQTWTVPSLSAGVAGIRLPELPRWRAWAVDRVAVAPKTSFTAREFYINYAPLETLENQTIRYTDPKISSSDGVLAGKVVLVGRGTSASYSADQHIVPGRRDATHAGVYVHACAAYTLMHGALEKLSAKGRAALDLGLSFLILFAVGAVRYHYRGAEPYGGIAHHRLHGFFTAIIVAIALGFGFYAVNVHRIMWDDSVFVAAAMLIHRKLESLTVDTTRFIVRLLTVSWALLLFKQDEDAYRPLDEHPHDR